MTISLQDPRLTAYALGELEGPEKAEVERALAQSAALREEVASIRRTGDEIREALEAEVPMETPPIDVEKLMRKAEVPSAHRGRWFVAATLMAASVVLALSLSWQDPLLPPPPPQVGELSPPTGRRLSKAVRPQPALPDSRTPVDRGGDTLAEATSRPTPAGRVRGTVTDPTGQPVPGVQLEVKHLASNETETRVSKEDGTFFFDRLSRGKVDLRASLEGFRPFTARLEVMDADQVVDPVLALGEITEEVTVSAAVPANIEMSAAFLRSPITQFSGKAKELMLAPSRGFPDEQAEEPTFNTEAYDRIDENAVKRVTDHPLSTFSIDVDTAAYSNMRSYLMDGLLPPPDSIRIEELVNYFPYDDLPPTGGDPFSVHVEVAEAPWKPDHLLLRIGLKGKEIAPAERPAANFVFLIDVSGSMSEPNKLPLLKRSLRTLVEQLQPADRVAIVVYAGASGLALPSTPAGDRASILAALEELEAGGSTNGGEGIVLAYRTAEENFIKGGINRVILTTDGDFNVGLTDQGGLTRLIEEKAKSGVFLSVLGFGMGNYKDSTLEKLADRGNGNYGYIDTLQEARKLLVDQMQGTLITIAKDVKIQVEFNPAQVAAYRLIGYENRRLAAEDFNDDRKDAGEIGAGHSVTALYELTLVGGEVDSPSVDPLKYQRPAQTAPGRYAHELLTIKLRYKRPDEDVSRLIEKAVVDPGTGLSATSEDFRFSAAVACFGMLLRDSKYKGSSSYEMALQLARQGLGPDRFGYRNEFVSLVERAREAGR